MALVELEADDAEPDPDFDSVDPDFEDPDFDGLASDVDLPLVWDSDFLPAPDSDLPLAPPDSALP